MNKIETSSWTEFKLSDLFEIQTTTGIDRSKINFVQDGKYDFIGRTSEGWGIQGRINDLSYSPNPKHTFSLVQVGETLALWRENEWYASQNIFILRPKYEEIASVPLFIQAVINKRLEKYGKAYTSYPTLKSLMDETLLLPSVVQAIPDFII